MTRYLNFISKEGKKFIHENEFKPSYFNDRHKTMSFYKDDLRLSDHWGDGMIIFNAILPKNAKKSEYLYLCKKILLPNNKREWLYLGIKFKRLLPNESFFNEDPLTVPMKIRNSYEFLMWQR